MWVLGIIWCQPAVGPDQGTYRYAAVIVLRQHQTAVSEPSHIIDCESGDLDPKKIGLLA